MVMLIGMLGLNKKGSKMQSFVPQRVGKHTKAVVLVVEATSVQEASRSGEKVSLLHGPG